MRVFLRLIPLLLLSACIKTAQTPTPSSPTPVPTVAQSSPTPPAQTPLVTIGANLGSSVDLPLVKAGIAEINRIFLNGCLERKFVARKFVSLHNIDGKQVQTNKEAFDRYIAGRPYALDVRWYVGNRFSNVVGYTYNYKDGYDSGPTETKIFSNSRIVYGYTANEYAAHLAHELSHQARAGGFVHWTVFDGSVPYEIGHIIEECKGVQ